MQKIRLSRRLFFMCINFDCFFLSFHETNLRKRFKRDTRKRYVTRRINLALKRRAIFCSLRFTVSFEINNLYYTRARDLTIFLFAVKVFFFR